MCDDHRLATTGAPAPAPGAAMAAAPAPSTAAAVVTAPAPAAAPAGAQRAAGANVTLQLKGVTRDQFTARQAEYNHIIAQARSRGHLMCSPFPLDLTSTAGRSHRCE